MNDNELPNAIAEEKLNELIKNFGFTSAPRVFGAPTWRLLHLWTLRYPIQPPQSTKERAAEFLANVFDNLGCGGCVNHAFKYAEQHPVNLDSKLELVWWMFDFHNAVNKRIGKPHFTKQQFFNEYILKPTELIAPAQLTKMEQFIMDVKTTKIVAALRENASTHKIVGFIFFILLLAFMYLALRYFYAQPNSETTEE